jgi:NADH:ubiquinone oxidoreductase subunit E
MIEGDWILPQKPLFHVRICINKRLNTDRLPSCGGRGSRGLAALLERMIAAEHIRATVIQGPCMNNCLNGPNLKIQGADYFNLQDDISDANVEKIMVAIRAEGERRKIAAAAEDAGGQQAP